MKLIARFLVVCSLLNCFALIPVALAQDEARPAWVILSYDIVVPGLGAERALTARATINARNVGRGAGSTLSVRINPTAEIKSVIIGSATATYQSRVESRGNFPRANSLRVTITLPASVAPNQNVLASIEYRLPVTENTGAAALSPIGSQFLPQSMWYPQVNNEFTLRGADYAPFRLTINGATALSSGIDKSAGGNSIFEQTLNGQPFFLTGAWEKVEGGPNGKGISAYLAKGAGADEKKQAESLIALANNARSFYAGLLGAAPDVPIRLIEVNRGAGFEDAGAILLGNGSFQRKSLDASSAMTISEAIARLWIGADTAVRGEGHGVVREGLTRFLATLFIEKEFGADAAEAERGRERVAYAAIAKRDGPLSRSTALSPATDGLTLAAVRASFADRSAAVKTLLDQQLDQTTDMDLMAGLPVQQGGEWIAALRNLGSIDVTVNVAATTNSGQRVTTKTTVPAHDFGQASFKNAANIVSVEVDPEKLYPQLDYANDVAPRVPEIAESLSEANRLYGAQEFAKAETLARQMLSASPRSQEARIVLGRTLLAETKNDEAEREFKQLLTEKLPLPTSLAWASYGLGEIALRRGQAAEASRLFTDAIRADAEYAATLAARAGKELGRFIQQIVGSNTEQWQTRVLRTEQLSADRIAVDVALTTKQLGVEHSGTAVFILARVGSSLKLDAIEFFEVR